VSEDYETQALQHPDEIAQFVDLVRGEQIGSYLEIGAKFGGSLWRIAQAMQPHSKIVAVDLPGGTVAWPKSRPSLEACIRALREDGHDARVIWGDSTNSEIISRVRALGPFDLVLIDGNHTLPFVEQDWRNYAPLAKMVAFHDIAWQRPDSYKAPPIDVPLFWQQIRNGYRSAEIMLDRTGQRNGIGVLWREQ
jgi:predicted O-methyltransferase YrrM